MKKLLLSSLAIILIATSCEKEETIYKVHFSTASEVRYSSNTHTNIISCKINGQEVDVFNPLIGSPVYTCKSGDKLEFLDSGYDWTTSTPTLNPPYMIYEYHEGYVESYIVVDNIVVSSYKGNGDANLSYILP